MMFLQCPDVAHSQVLNAFKLNNHGLNFEKKTVSSSDSQASNGLVSDSEELLFQFLRIH